MGSQRCHSAGGSGNLVRWVTSLWKIYEIFRAAAVLRGCAASTGCTAVAGGRLRGSVAALFAGLRAWDARSPEKRGQRVRLQQHHTAGFELHPAALFPVA